MAEKKTSRLIVAIIAGLAAVLWGISGLLRAAMGKGTSILAFIACIVFIIAAVINFQKYSRGE